jgi:hypothetical protein
MTTVDAHVPVWPQAIKIGRQMRNSPIITTLVDNMANLRLHQMIIRCVLITAMRRRVTQMELLRNSNEKQYVTWKRQRN